VDLGSRREKESDRAGGSNETKEREGGERRDSPDDEQQTETSDLCELELQPPFLYEDRDEILYDLSDEEGDEDGKP